MNPFPFSRRDFLLQAAGIATGTWAGAHLTTNAIAENTVPLRIARYKGRGDISLILRGSGIENPPYPIAYSEFSGGNLITQALDANVLDLGTMSEIPPIFVADTNPAFRIIGVIRGDVNIQAVLVPPNSKIQSIADLKGKRVGYIRATTCHYFLIKMLAEHGLTFDDITAANLAPADGLAAFVRGSIDAWAIYGYSISLAVHNHGARVLKTALGYLSGNYLVAAHVDAIKDPDRHREIEDYLHRASRAFQWMNTHHKEWSVIEAQTLGLAPELILKELENESAPWQVAGVDAAAIHSQQDVADTFFDAGLLPKRINVTSLWDQSFTIG